MLILRRLLEECRAKGKRLYICFVNLEKALDRASKEVLEWAMRKKGIPEVLVGCVISLHMGATTRNIVDS